MSCTLLNEMNMDALYRDTEVLPGGAGGGGVSNILHIESGTGTPDPMRTINRNTLGDDVSGLR